MPGPQPRRDPAKRVAAATARRAPISQGPGVRQVTRRDPGQVESGDVWVVVEPEADIAAKGHPYISFDPAGTYP